MRYVITVQEQPETWSELSAGAKVVRCLQCVISLAVLAVVVSRR